MGRFCKIVLAFMLVNMVTVLYPIWARGNPSELPQVSIQPSAITVWEGETFSLNFTISNLDAGFEMIGFSAGSDFSNSSVLELESVKEGSFMKQFPTPPYTSEDCTLFIIFFVYPGWANGILLLPAVDPNVTNPVFPEGNGTLMTMDFKAKAQGTTNLTFEAHLQHGNLGAVTEVKYDLNATIEVKHQNGDLNGDGRVDIRDISLAARAFGSVHGDPNWMFQADMNQDSKIDIRDIALIAKNFGKTFS